MEERKQPLSKKQQRKRQGRIVMAGFTGFIMILGGLLFWLGPKDNPEKIMSDARSTMTQLLLANVIANGDEAKEEPAATILREYNSAVEVRNLNKVMKAVVEMHSHLAQSDLSPTEPLGKYATYASVCRKVDRLQRRMSKL